MKLKKMMCATVAGMMAGAGLTAYCMSNKKTKRHAKKMLNNAIDEANKVIGKMN